jgi:hypothetical protein
MRKHNGICNFKIHTTLTVRLCRFIWSAYFKPLNAELKHICHLLALLGAHHILHVSRIRVNVFS